jgi:hypothetical protein
MATNYPGTKTRSFQQVARFFGANNLVIHILECITPQLCLKLRAPRVGPGKERLRGRLQPIGDATKRRCSATKAKPTISALRDGAHYVYARKEPRSGERGAVLAAS